MFEVIGIVTTVLGLVFGILVATDCTNNEDGFKITFCRFGFIWVKREGSNVHKILNEARKTEGKKFFLTAPTWFNTKVWNIGGMK